jgi:hypothetical protein
MTSLGPPVAPPEPDATTSSNQIPLWLVIGCVLLMVLGVGLVGYVLLNGETSKEKSPPYPSSWDPRIAPYAKIAEKQRGLTFLHPVAVRFLANREFSKTVQADENKIDEDDRREIERSAGLLRAFGLLSGDVDLLAAGNEVAGSGVLAYYSFEDKRITIRGTRLTPAARPTIVHELTHALQDQHFGVGDRLAVLAKKNAKTSTTEYDVLDAIVEGDASRVEHAYLAGLSPAQRKAVARSSRAQNHRAAEAYSKVPQVVVTMFTAPYTLGEALVRAVAEDHGNSGVDDLLRDAPAHDSVLLDPFRVLLADKDARPPAVPAVDAGDEKFASGEFGAVFWYLTLAERLPVIDALTTVDGWDGDAYVAYEHDGVTCARAAYQGKSAADTSSMLVSLQRWIAAGAGTPASVIRTGSGLLFQSCDPGKAAKPDNGALDKAIAIAVSRTNLGVVIMHSGAPEQYARCISDKAIRTFTIAQLNDPHFGQNDPSVRNRIIAMVHACQS